jgi:hypothetical protein
MSSASAWRARLIPRLRAAVRALGWGIVAAIMAVAAAGLVGQLWHPAGGPARAELTWLGDLELTAALEGTETGVLDVAAEVDRLAEEARIALAAAASSDLELLAESLSRGTAKAAAIESAVVALRQDLRSLPGDEPDAALHYRNSVVVRRAALLAAIDAAGGLPGHWGAVTSRSSDVVELLGLIDAHDQRVLAAAAEGRAGRYRRATTVLEEALGVLTAIEELRAKLVSGLEPTILDEWVDRNRTYDRALSALYEALRESRGRTTVAVQSAAREERIAREGLPADRRAIVVIVSEVARGGLNQAVLAIEETRGRIDAALADVVEDGNAEPAGATPAGGG